MEQEPCAALLDARDAVEDVLLRPGRQPSDATQGAFFGGGTQLLELTDPQLLVEQLDRPGANPLDA